VALESRQEKVWVTSYLAPRNSLHNLLHLRVPQSLVESLLAAVDLW